MNYHDAVINFKHQIVGLFGDVSLYELCLIMLLQYRTAKLLQTVALRLRKHSKQQGSFEAWNQCLNHLLMLAESHIETVILEKFIEAVNR